MTALVSHSYSHREHFLVFGYSVEGLRRINDLYGENMQINKSQELLRRFVKNTLTLAEEAFIINCGMR